MVEESRIRKSFEKVKSEINLLKEAVNDLKKKNVLPLTLWLTGLPCSGKTTIAKKLEQILKKEGYFVGRLDGDDVRQGINSDLKFSEKDREENLRRVGHIAELFNERGMIVVASFVSPLEKNRLKLKSIIKNFHLIYIKCSVEECIRRDTKGMYKLARAGKIKNFTGVSAPFEEPKNPDFILDSEKYSVEDCVQKIIENFFS